jgi:hypothetical protein
VSLASPNLLLAGLPSDMLDAALVAPCGCEVHLVGIEVVRSAFLAGCAARARASAEGKR